MSGAASFEPNLVCNALVSEGYPPRISKVHGGIWGDSGLGFACDLDSIIVTKGGYAYVGDVDNILSYYAESNKEDCVQKNLLYCKNI